jgi:hypothetical protein
MNMNTGTLYSGWTYRFDDNVLELLHNGVIVATFKRGKKYLIHTTTGKRFGSVATAHKFVRGQA